MNNNLKLLFDKLNKYWKIGNDERFFGENPACQDVQDLILAELVAMPENEAIKTINELTDEQITQIVPVIQDIIVAIQKSKDLFYKINTSRNIPDLDDELRILKMLEKPIN